MRHLFLPAVAAASFILPAYGAEPVPIPSPGEIAAAAPTGDWVAIAPSDLLVMDLAPDASGKARRVVIQLMPAPFSQQWIGNIRKLAAAHWWDGTSVNRVQDNYVTQWGDATEKKALPKGLATVPESEYVTPTMGTGGTNRSVTQDGRPLVLSWSGQSPGWSWTDAEDAYSTKRSFFRGWAFVSTDGKTGWPVHCYGMVGVGRNMSPDTGSGAELYTVIGHAPRHLDRNIAVVGRVIGGIEHLSSLPRGTEALGFYKTEAERTPILSIRIANELPAAEQPKFEYLSTESDSFARYADARQNRRDPFFITPAGGADICNIPVPIRQIAAK